MMGLEESFRIGVRQGLGGFFGRGFLGGRLSGGFGGLRGSFCGSFRGGFSGSFRGGFYGFSGFRSGFFRWFFSVKFFSEFGEASLATGGGIFLQETLFDGFIVFALDFLHIFGGRGSLKGFKGEFDGFFNFEVFKVALRGLASGFLGGFNNRH